MNHPRHLRPVSLLLIACFGIAVCPLEAAGDVSSSPALWRSFFDARQGVATHVDVADNGTLAIIRSDEGEKRVFELETGTFLRTIDDVTSPASSSGAHFREDGTLVVLGDRLVGPVRGAPPEITALDLRRGRPIWSLPIGPPAGTSWFIHSFTGTRSASAGTSVLAAGLVHSPARRSPQLPPRFVILGIDDTGHERWRHPLQQGRLERDRPLGLATLGSRVFVLTADLLASIDAGSGTVGWSVATPATASSAARSLVAGTTRLAFAVTGTTELRVIAPETGAALGTVTLPGPLVDPLTTRDDHAYAVVTTASAHQLVDIDLSSQRVAWQTTLPAGGSNLRTTTDLVLVATADGFVRAYDRRSGALAWTADLGPTKAFAATDVPSLGPVVLRHLDRELVAIAPARTPPPAPRQVQISGLCRVREDYTDRLRPPDACSGATVTAAGKTARVDATGHFRLTLTAIDRVRFTIETTRRKPCDVTVTESVLDVADRRSSYATSVDVACVPRRE